MKINILNLNKGETGIEIKAVAPYPVSGNFPHVDYSRNRTEEEKTKAHKEAMEILGDAQVKFKEEEKAFRILHLGEAELTQEEER